MFHWYAVTHACRNTCSLAALLSPRHTFLNTRLLTGAEAESGGSAPSPVSQQAARHHQAPRGNKTRHRPGTNSHPPASSLAPPTDGGTSGGKKIGQSSLAFTPSVLYVARCSVFLFFFFLSFFKPYMTSPPQRPTLTGPSRTCRDAPPRWLAIGWWWRRKWTLQSRGWSRHLRSCRAGASTFRINQNEILGLCCNGPS